MAISSRLKTFLAKQKITYTSHKHPTAYTAQEIAAAQHVSGKQLAKCVLVKTDKGHALAVLPAIELVDFAKLKNVLRVKKLSLASEPDIQRLFPDVDVGAMSPFGNLYNIPTVVDKALTEAEEIVCNAGSHTQTVTLRYRDFEKWAAPRVGSFGRPASKAAKPKKRAKA